MQSKKAQRRALCGSLSTFLLEDGVGGVRSQPQQRGIFFTRSKYVLLLSPDHRSCVRRWVSLYGARRIVRVKEITQAFERSERCASLLEGG